MHSHFFKEVLQDHLAQQGRPPSSILVTKAASIILMSYNLALDSVCGIPITVVDSADALKVGELLVDVIDVNGILRLECSTK